MKRFIEQIAEHNFVTEYGAGKVMKDENDFFVGYETLGALDTFSIGQPVYDGDKNLMGYLGIGFYKSLDYSTENNIRVPVEYWKICLPTKYCKEGKTVYTYWQTHREVIEE